MVPTQAPGAGYHHRRCFNGYRLITALQSNYRVAEFALHLQQLLSRPLSTRFRSNGRRFHAEASRRAKFIATAVRSPMMTHVPRPAIGHA
jgi:hypothetical protein